MIADAFCAVVTAFLNTVFAALPTFNGGAVFQGGITGDTHLYQGLFGASGGTTMGPLGAVLLTCWQLNNFFPVDQAAEILISVGAIVGYKTFKMFLDWLIGLIP